MLNYQGANHVINFTSGSICYSVPPLAASPDRSSPPTFQSSPRKYESAR